MPRSYNGWQAGTASQLGIRVYDVPGPSRVDLALNPDAAPILLYWAEWWDANVEDIDTHAGHRTPDDYGHNYRLTRGENNWSNHASGTAIDINALLYPWRTAHMTAAKVAKIRAKLGQINKISRRLNGHNLLDWGGNYVRAPKDQMHTELSSGTSPSDVKRVMAELKRKGRPSIDVSRLKTALTTSKMMYAPGSVLRVQRALKRRGYLKKYLPGRAGLATRAALQSYLRRRQTNMSNMTTTDVRALVGPDYYVHN